MSDELKEQKDQEGLRKLEQYMHQYNSYTRKTRRDIVVLLIAAAGIAIGISINSFVLVVLSGTVGILPGSKLLGNMVGRAGIVRKAEKELGIDLTEVYADEEDEEKEKGKEKAREEITDEEWKEDYPILNKIRQLFKWIWKKTDNE